MVIIAHEVGFKQWYFFFFLVCVVVPSLIYCTFVVAQGQYLYLVSAVHYFFSIFFGIKNAVYKMYCNMNNFCGCFVHDIILCGCSVNNNLT